MSPLWGYLYDFRRKLHPPVQQINFISGDKTLQKFPQVLQQQIDHFFSLNEKQQNPINFITQLKVSEDTDDDLNRTIQFSYGDPGRQLAAAKYQYGEHGYIFVVQDIKYNSFEEGQPLITVPSIAAGIQLQDSVQRTQWKIWKPRKLIDLSRWHIGATVTVTTGPFDQLNSISLRHERDTPQVITSPKTENSITPSALQASASINDPSSRLNSSLQGSAGFLDNDSWGSQPLTSFNDSRDSSKQNQEQSVHPSISITPQQLGVQAELKTATNLSEKRGLVKDENEPSQSKVMKKQRSIAEHTVMRNAPAATTNPFQPFMNIEPSQLPSAGREQASYTDEIGWNADDNVATTKDTDMKVEHVSEPNIRVDDREIEVQFQFKKELHSIPTRTRSFSDISSSERLFKQASCANILPYGEDILSVHLDGREPINIMRNDDEDYNRVVELIERQKIGWPTHSIMVVIVTPGEW